MRPPLLGRAGGAGPPLLGRKLLHHGPGDHCGKEAPQAERRPGQGQRGGGGTWGEVRAALQPSAGMCSLNGLGIYPAGSLSTSLTCPGPVCPLAL